MDFLQRKCTFKLLCVLVLLWSAHADCFDVVVKDVDDDDITSNQSAHIYYDHQSVHVANSQAVGDVGSSRSNRDLQTATVGQIVDLLLVNADTNRPIRRLVNGTIINLGPTGTTNLNVQATVTTTGTVGSVRFGYNATTNYMTQNTAPFSLCGNAGTDYRPCPMLSKVGTHTITATSYSGKKATGVVGSQKKVSFRIADLNPVPPALPSVLAPSPIVQPKAPTKAPMKSPVPVKTCTIPKFVSPWESLLPSYPFIVNEAQADLIQNDIVITGGFTNSFQNVTNHTYARSIVNIGTTTWIRMDDMPVRVGITHAATVVVGTRMYMCGGYVGPPPGPHTSDCFIYDHSIPPGTGRQWTRFSSLPNNGTAGGSMIFDSRTNTIYYTGGAQRPNRGSRLAIDITSTWKISLGNIFVGWRSSTPIPYEANHQSYVTVNYLQQGERNYFFGGQVGEDERNGNVDDVYEFQPSTETWIRRANMPYPRGHTTVSSRAIGSCGYITAGGSANSGANSLRLNRTADIHYYHIPTNTWYYMGTLPQPIATPPVFIGSDNYMYFVARTMVNRRRFSL